MAENTRSLVMGMQPYPSGRLTLTYVAVACGWILVTYGCLGGFCSDPALVRLLSTLNACLLVAASALFLHRLAPRAPEGEAERLCRDRLELLVRERTAELAAVQRMAQIGSYRYDFGANRWTGSQLLDEILGIGPQFRRTRAGWSRLLHPADRCEIHRHVSEAVAKGVGFDREHRIVRDNDGAERWVHALGEVTYDAEGAPLCLVGTVQDITQRKRSEQALRASEQRFRTLIERAPVAIRICRAAVIVYANRKFLELFGFDSVDEVRDRSVGVLWAPECREERVQHALKRSMGLPVPSEYEGNALRKDGTLFPVYVAATSVLLADGIANLAFVSDISERKEAEEAVLRYAGRLMELEEELRRDIAMELHDHIGQELTALGLNLAFVASALGESSGELALKLEDSRLLTRGISQSVRAMMTELRPPQLDELGLPSALRFHAELFRQRTGIAVEVRADAQLPRLPGETETALFRIVQEALTNVVKHAGAQTVTISLERGTEGMRLTIADDGTGFSPGGALPEADGGWGITIMRERAALIGGSFGLEAAPGRGTRVEVALREGR